MPPMKVQLHMDKTIKYTMLNKFFKARFLAGKFLFIKYVLQRIAVIGAIIANSNRHAGPGMSAAFKRARLKPK